MAGLHGSLDFAPEIVNISTLDDTMFDVGVRYFSTMPDMYANGTWNTNFVANYQHDILPIIQRISRYQWVSNVQSMSVFCSYIFDFGDPSAAMHKTASNISYSRNGRKESLLMTPIIRHMPVAP